MIENDIRKEADRLVTLAENENFILKLLGGLAIYLQCPSIAKEPFKRDYSDIDVIGYSKDTKLIQDFFLQNGYIEDHEFNTMYGHERLFFWDQKNDRHVDVFLDQMRLCHTIDFKTRLENEKLTLTLADLILTKLQVVEINKKDIMDVIAIFKDHNVGKKDNEINVPYITSVLSKDWGFWRTVTNNLVKLKSFTNEVQNEEDINSRIDYLLDSINRSPKSVKWKLRSYVGERIRWYELPAEEGHG